jgi:hypothetical protein
LPPKYWLLRWQLDVKPLKPTQRELGASRPACLSPVGQRTYHLSGKEIERVRARGAVTVIKQRPVTVLLAASPALLVLLVAGGATVSEPLESLALLSEFRFIRSRSRRKVLRPGIIRLLQVLSFDEWST